MIKNHVQATDYEPAAAVRVKQMIWSDLDRTFRTQYFWRVYCEDLLDMADTVHWLTQQFGGPRHHHTWWLDSSNPRRIWLADDVADSWKLRQGQTA
jgi:hypothetical protein